MLQSNIFGGRRLWFFLAAFFVVVYLSPLGARPLMITSEPRHGVIPREMLASGDWIVPRLNGLRYFEKTPLGYWLTAASMSVFGENAFALRLPSALATLATTLMVCLLAMKFFDRETAFLASLFHLSSAMVFALATSPVLDALLTMCLTWTLGCFLLAFKAESLRQRLGWLALMGVFCGLAFLAKGFLAFVVPGLVIAPFLLWERRWRELFVTMPWIPIVLAALVVIPWGVAIHLREPDFWRYFVWQEHIHRFLADKSEVEHPAPFWFFVPVLLGGVLPWALFIPFSGARGWAEIFRRKDLFRFACCWLVFPFLFFSASSGKLPTYILPCFPAAALIMAAGLKEYFLGRNARTRVLDWLCAILATAAALTVAALVFNWLFALPKPLYYPEELGKLVVATLACALACGLWLAARWQAPGAGKLAVFTAGFGALFLCSQLVIPEWFNEEKAPYQLLARNSRFVTPETIVSSHQYPIRAVCWHFRRDDVRLLVPNENADRGELDYGLGYPDAGERLITLDGFIELVTKTERPDVVLITPPRQYQNNLRYGFPEPKHLDVSRGFVFAVY